MTLPLDGIVIVDLAGTIVSGYCAKLLADAGAEVWNVEPSEGFATRRLPPLSGRESALHAFLSTNKHSIVIDRSSAATNDSWQQLLAAAHLVLCDGLPPDDIGPDQLTLSVSWFGIDGPYATFAGSDAACRPAPGQPQSPHDGLKPRPLPLRPASRLQPVLRALAPGPAAPAGA